MARLERAPPTTRGGVQSAPMSRATADPYAAVLADVTGGMGVGNALTKHKKSSNEFYRRLALDPELEKRYERAKSDSLRKLADDTLEIADGTDEPDVKRVRIDTRKWLLAKLQPKKYGDRVDLNHGGAVAVTVSPRDVKAL